MTLIDEKGNKLRSGRVWNARCEVEEFLQGEGDGIKAVIEAGRSSYTMVDLMEELRIKVTIAHPQELRAIAKAKIKTDARSSHILADLLRADLIPEVYRRDGENRRKQRVLRLRSFFVGTLTRVKNKIRALVAQQREEVQREAGQEKSLFSKKGLEKFKGLELPRTDKDLLDALLKTYFHFKERIKESDGLVERLFTEMREAQLISTVPGFGKFFSVLVATEIADVRRFSKVEKLHSYAGVIPATFSSGERAYHGKIIKEGNKWLRWAAVEAVWPAIKSDNDLLVFYERHARRKDANAAKMATARRLLTIIYRLLKENREYIPYKR
jgi:transposase